MDEETSRLLDLLVSRLDIALWELQVQDTEGYTAND